jgi:hypothetical protein
LIATIASHLVQLTNMTALARAMLAWPGLSLVLEDGSMPAYQAGDLFR